MDRSPGGVQGVTLGGSSGVTQITTSKKFHFCIIHIILNKIDVNLTEKILDLVDFVGSAGAHQGGRKVPPHPLLAIPAYQLEKNIFANYLAIRCMENMNLTMLGNTPNSHSNIRPVLVS